MNDMPKRPEIKVNVSFEIIPDEEFRVILNSVKNWYVESFLRWFEQQLNQLSIENQKANGVVDKDIIEHVFDNCFR